MYEKFYGFTEKPFNLTPDPDFFFLSSVHKRALDHLVYGLESGMGFIQVTGEIGSGKTTLIKCLLRQLSREVKVAYVIHSKGTFVQILRMILEDLEVVAADHKLGKEALLSRLRDYLAEQARYHNSVVVIIDEAQNLTPHEVKTIISRAGKGTKVILTGDATQIDNPYLDQDSNGLTYCVNRFKNQRIFGHMFLERTERSELASIAAEIL